MPEARKIEPCGIIRVWQSGLGALQAGVHPLLLVYVPFKDILKFTAPADPPLLYLPGHERPQSATHDLSAFMVHVQEFLDVGMKPEDAWRCILLGRVFKPHLFDNCQAEKDVKKNLGSGVLGDMTKSVSFHLTDWRRTFTTEKIEYQTVPIGMLCGMTALDVVTCAHTLGAWEAGCSYEELVKMSPKKLATYPRREYTLPTCYPAHRHEGINTHDDMLEMTQYHLDMGDNVMNVVWQIGVWRTQLRHLYIKKDGVDMTM